MSLSPRNGTVNAMSTAAREYRFRLRISRDEMLRYYGGQAAAVQARSEDGRQVRFPANVLRPFITAAGVDGRFLLRVDAHNRVLGLERIGD